MSRGFEGHPTDNPNNCTDPYTPSFWLGKPGVLTQIRMPDGGIQRGSSDNFAVHSLLDGQAVDRSPYLCRAWTFQHQWLRPEIMSVFMEYATRQRGFGPFILIDPQMKNLLTPNQASGTDALHTSEGFAVTGSAGLSSSTFAPVQGERSLRWDTLSLDQILDTYTRNVAAGSWGTSDSGQTYILIGTASDFLVTGGVGRMTTTTVNSLYYATLDSGSTNHTVQVTITLPVLPATSAITLRVLGRYLDSANYYEAQLFINTAGLASLALQKRVASVGSGLTSGGASASVGTHVAGNSWTIIFDLQGQTLRARTWNATSGTDSGLWQTTGTDASLTAGTRVGSGTRRESGNTNGTVNVDSDNLLVLNPLGGGPLKLVPPSGLFGWCLPVGKKFAFSGYLTGAAANPSITVTPRVVLMDATGSVQSTINGAVITPISGSPQSFCVTGSVPVGTGGVYIQPQFTQAGSVLTPTVVGVQLDQLQLELIDGTICTQWEYGQGQPLVGVRADGENVPRILRTNVNYIAVEVT